MNASQLTCPTEDQLSAFSVGKLLPLESENIERHLAECPSCCQLLKQLPDNDTLVGLLRESEDTSVCSPAPEEIPGELPSRSERVTLAPEEELTEAGGETALGRSQLPESLRAHSRYRILGLLGRGGMGDVYKAHHRLMNRPVAIKLINGQLVRSPAAIQRFHREMEAAARLSHPNIVTAHDAEQAGDSHFLVMEFVDGTELGALVREKGPLPVAEACDYIRQAAEGLQHAHELGMVHRDIKPQNLMVTHRGRRPDAQSLMREDAEHGSGANASDEHGTVKILDFGLANFAAEIGVGEQSDVAASDPEHPTRAHLTVSGSIVGTPEYISPEQASDAHTADIRSDIYSLGCTLYCLLAGEPPFRGDSVLEKVSAHAEREPRPLTDHRSDVPQDLEVVLRRMLAKNPDERFQTPGEVAKALGPFTGTQRLAVGRAKRSGLFAKMVAACLLPLVIAAGVMIYLAVDTGQIEIDARQADFPGAKIVLLRDGKEYATFNLDSSDQVQRIRAGQYEIQLRNAPSDASVNVWSKRGDTNDWGSPDGHENDPVVLYRGGGMLIEVSRRRTPTRETVTDYDRLQGEWIAESGVRGGQAIPREQIGMQRAEFRGNHLSVVMPVGLTGQDGATAEGEFQLIASDNPKQMWIQVRGRSDGMRGIYKLDDDRLTLCMNQDRQGPVPTEFVSPPGTTVDLILLRRASENSDRPTTAFIEPPSTAFEALLRQQNRAVTGNTLPVVIWERNRQAAFRFGNWLLVFAGVPCQASPGSAGLLGIGGFNYPIPWGKGTVGVTTFGDQVTFRGHWDSEASEITVADKYTFKIRGRGDRLEFDDRTYVATDDMQTVVIANDGTTRLIVKDAFSHALLARIKHDGPMQRIAFSPDGKRILLGGVNGSLLLHEVSTGKQLRELRGHTRTIRSLMFSADGKEILSSGWDGTIRIWDVSSGESTRIIQGGDGLLHSAYWSNDGERILSCSHVGASAGAIRLWNGNTGELLREFENVSFQPFEVVFSPDAALALSGGHDAVMRLWDVASGKEVRKFRGHNNWVITVAFSHDGARAASAGADHTVRIWEVESGQELRRLTGHSDLVESVLFAPDDRYLLSASHDGTMRWWDTVAGEEIQRIEGHEKIQCAALSATGRVVAVSSADGTTRILRLPDQFGQSAASLEQSD